MPSPRRRNGAAAKVFMDSVTEIVIHDANTFTVKLGAPNAHFPVLLGLQQLHIVKDGTTDFTTANGTGPYKVKEFRAGVRSVGVRDDNYFKDGRPYFDEVEWFGITDNAARLNALLSGDIHVMGELSLRSLRQIEATPGVEALTTNAGQYVDFVMMSDRAPFDNPDARFGIKDLRARLKGATAARVVLWHALPNAIGPIVNVIALNLAYLVSGVVVVETIFNYPGLARLTVDAVIKRDMPLVQGCVMVFCVVYVLLILVADVVSVASNPRLRHPRWSGLPTYRALLIRQAGLGRGGVLAAGGAARIVLRAL